jgi:GTP pyrophosphokinase
LTPKPLLSYRYKRALEFAFQLHRTQLRKGTPIPYFSHLMAVSSLVMEYGGDEDEAIAGLLHDAVEDQGGPATLVKINRRFGSRVAEIVSGCSDTDQKPKPPWHERKQAYLAHLETASPSILLVSCADKYHNASKILAEFHQVGMPVFDRFNAGPDDSLQYYRRLAKIFLLRGNPALAAELERVVAELDSLVKPHLPGN